MKKSWEILTFLIAFTASGAFAGTWTKLFKAGADKASKSSAAISDNLTEGLARGIWERGGDLPSPPRNLYQILGDYLEKHAGAPAFQTAMLNSFYKFAQGVLDKTALGLPTQYSKILITVKSAVPGLPRPGTPTTEELMFVVRKINSCTVEIAAATVPKGNASYKTAGTFFRFSGSTAKDLVLSAVEEGLIGQGDRAGTYVTAVLSHVLHKTDEFVIRGVKKAPSGLEVVEEISSEAAKSGARNLIDALGAFVTRAYDGAPL